MNSEIHANEIVGLLKESKLCLAKLEKIMEPRKLKKGVKYRPRFRVRVSSRFIKTYGLEEGDFVYIIPQKLFDNLDYKHHYEANEKGNISERRDPSIIKLMDLVTFSGFSVLKDNNIARVEKIVEAKPVIIRAKDKEYKKARIVVDLPPEYIGKKFKLVEV
jgi:hypothetical protein